MRVGVVRWVFAELVSLPKGEEDPVKLEIVSLNRRANDR